MANGTTMKDIAALAGVSAMTVSRAFKRDSSVTKETREAVLRAAEELGYVFDATASNLRSQRTGFVAVTIPSLNNANFADTVGALSATLAQAELEVLLGYSNYDIASEERLIEQLLRRRPEAIVLTGGRHTERAHKMLANAGIPVVETWDLPENPIGHVVGFSNGIRVPEDIAIAGFGAYDISAMSVPTITTINPFPAEIGKRAAEVITALLRSGAQDHTQVYEKIVPEIMVGQSTTAIET